MDENELFTSLHVIRDLPTGDFREKEDHFSNQQARDFLALTLALEELKLEYKELRAINGNAGRPRTTREETQLRLVIVTLEYIVMDAMWDWLETCP